MLARLPQQRPKSLQPERDRDHDQCEAAEERRRPARAEALVHLCREQREDGAEDGADDDRGGECARGDGEVRVDRVVEEREEDEDHRGRHRDARRERRPDRDGGEGCPAKPEEAERVGRRAVETRLQAVLGWHGGGCVLGHRAFVAGVEEDEVEDDTDAAADEDRQEGKTDEASIEVVAIAVNDWVCLKEGVYHPIYELNVVGMVGQ